MAVASAVGHWVQLMRLRAAWAGQRLTYVTTDPALATVASDAARAIGEPVPGFHAVPEANRRQPFGLLRQLLWLSRIIRQERPDLVITTGASAGYFALRLGRISGARTVWIDSMANASELSLSGRKIRRHADLWLTQWPHLARPDGPFYLGAVL